MKQAIITLAALMLCQCVFSATIHVAPDGDDGAAGDGSAPLATLGAAVERAHGAGGGEVVLHGGVYHLSETLVLSGINNLTIRSAEGEQAVIDGGVELRDWRRTLFNGKAAWEAPVAVPVKRLYYQGRAMRRASFPKGNAFYRIHDETRRPLWNSSDNHVRVEPGSVNPSWCDLAGIDVRLIHKWVSEILPVTGYDAEAGQLISSHYSRFGMDQRDCEYRLENVAEALLEEGEFYYDAKGKRVVVILDAELSVPGGEKPSVPVVGALIVADGCRKLSLEGLLFRHAGAFDPGNTLQMDLRNGLEMTNYAIYGDPNDPCWQDGEQCYGAAPQAAANVPGIVIMNRSSDCRIRKCRFEASGWYGLHVAGGCRDVAVDRNEFRELGAGGIRINGATTFANAVDQSCRVVVTNNHIHDCTQYFMGATGIFVTDAYGNLIEHNHIHDMYYSGISVGWTWGFGDSVSRENRIGWNRIERLGKDAILSDMGGIYLLGVQPGTRVYSNYIAHVTRRYYGGCGIYTDEGSSHIVIENNVVADCASCCFHQHYGRENTLRWNIFAFGGDEPFRISRGNEHWKTYPGENMSCVLTSFQNVILAKDTNLISSAHAGALSMPTFISEGNVFWRMDGKEDEPLARSESKKWSVGWQQWRELGYDATGTFAEPGFRNPLEGDFSFPPESLLGRRRFPQLEMSQVGILPE